MHFAAVRTCARSQELGLTSISLDYDANYSDVDQWGNEIKMKSSATTADGLKHVVMISGSVIGWRTR